MHKCGPCPTCGLKFESRVPKKFCCLACYTSSTEFLERVRGQARRATDASVRKQGIEPGIGKITPCPECGEGVYSKPHQLRKKRYCSSLCYRKFMSKRFDRFVANPETVALPQNYDEFLSSPLLNCLIDGCQWRGHRLSQHMNLTHGVQARQFKKLAGFNLKSGIVSAGEHQALSMLHKDSLIGRPLPPKTQSENKTDTYISRERVEHLNKGRLLAMATHIPASRICNGCGAKFVQPTPFGRALFCSVDCRGSAYAKQLRAKTNDLLCDVCGAPFKGSKDQANRSAKGLPVMCSMECRQRRAGRIARGTWTTSS